MRWPFRRRATRPDPPRPVAPLPSIDGSDGGLHGAPTRPPLRAEWAKLAPIRPTVRREVPTTFDGERFGRSVAGARDVRHRTTSRRADAPAGVLLDVAQVETVVPADPHPGTTDPLLNDSLPDSSRPVRQDGKRTGMVTGDEAYAGLVLRTVAVTARPDDVDLLHADHAPDFPQWSPASREQRSNEAIEFTSWTAEHGFADPTSPAEPTAPADNASDSPPSGMRLVGQRGSFDDAIAPVDEPRATPTAAEPDAMSAPTVRFVPMPGERERPPADLVSIVAAATGTDVGDTEIDRSPAVTMRATVLGAVAYTERGTVHLPAELGPLDHPTVRGVVAHELTHVAQQRNLGDGLPDEDSAPGRRLEAQARRVQASVAGPVAGSPLVQPTFLRAGPAPTGVQRLSSDDDYDWQDRGDPPSADDATSIGDVLTGGMFSRHASDDTRRARDAADERWARDYEREHAVELQARRDDHHADLVEQAEEELELRIRRGDVAEGTTLTRADHIEIRQRLDDDMPWEHGIPEGIDPYPGELPPVEPGDTTRPRGMRSPLVSATGGRRARTVARDARTIGRSSGSLLHRRGRDDDDDEENYDWQGRSATRSETISTIFGGAFGTIIGGIFGSGDEEEERREAERERLPKLIPRRHRDERRRRHEALDDKRADALRSETGLPAQLEDAEIAAIRAEVDEELPLEFGDELGPELLYLDADIDGRIDEDGVITDRLDDAPDSDTDADADADADAAGPNRPTAAPDLDAALAAAMTAGAERSEPAASGTATAVADRRTDPDDDAGDVSGDAGAGSGSQEIASSDTNTSSDLFDDLFDDDIDAGAVFAAATEVDLDHLAHRLFGRIRRDLRRELLIDRERAGVLADVH